MSSIFWHFLGLKNIPNGHMYITYMCRMSRHKNIEHEKFPECIPFDLCAALRQNVKLVFWIFSGQSTFPPLHPALYSALDWRPAMKSIRTILTSWWNTSCLTSCAILSDSLADISNLFFCYRLITLGKSLFMEKMIILKIL